MIRARRKEMVIVAGLALVLAVPVMLALNDNRFMQHVLFMIFLFAALAGGWNILGGYGGQLSLGHASFFGIGAYTSTLLLINYGVSPWFGMLIAIGIATVSSFVIGIPTFRLKGPFFALATIAVGEVLRICALEWRSITHGANGLVVNSPFGAKYMMFHSKLAYVGLAFVLMLMVICIARRLENSKLGYCLLAVRENESAAEALGVNITKTKMVALVISGCITAVCGVVYAQYVWYIEPGSVFSNAFSVQITLTAIIGGLTTVWGPIIGAVFLIPLGEILRVYLGGGGHGIYLMIYGVLLIAVVRMLPKGIMSILDRLPKGILSILNRSNDNTDARGGS